MRDGRGYFKSQIHTALCALVSGVIIGAAASLFQAAMSLGDGYMRGGNFFRPIFLPLGLVLGWFIMQRMAPRAKGLGMSHIDGALRHSWQKPLRIIPARLAGAVAVIVFGGSAGKAGPCAQLGAWLAAEIVPYMKLTDSQRRVIVASGVAAGFASAMGTPITACMFALEMFCAGTLFYEAMLPSLLSACSAAVTSYLLGIKYIEVADVSYNIPFTFKNFMILAAFGVFFGLVSRFHVLMIRGADRAVRRIGGPRVLRPILGGALLLALTFAVGDRYLGLGTDTIEAVIVSGASVPLAAFALKSFFTAVTVSASRCGGLITPTLFVGACAGAAAAQLAGLDISYFGILGFVAVMAGCARVPVASVIMAAELFGREFVIPAVIVCTISYMLSDPGGMFRMKA